MVLRTLIGDEARQFDFLKSSSNLSDDDKEAYARLTEVGATQGGFYTMTETMAAASLKILSQLLYKHYAKKLSYYNLKVHMISDVRYDEFFGFTNADVDEMLAAPSASPLNYWANTRGNGLILHLLEKADRTTKDEVEEPLNGGKITKKVRQELTYRDFEDSVENVWSVLYATGYLTGRHVDKADADRFSLWIPNGEIRKLFYELVEDWFRGITRSDTERINRFCAAFPAGATAEPGQVAGQVQCGDEGRLQ